MLSYRPCPRGKGDQEGERWTAQTCWRGSRPLPKIGTSLLLAEAPPASAVRSNRRSRGYRTLLLEAGRLRSRHLEPQHEARPWRRALLAARERLARARSARGARPSARECTPPRARSPVRRAQLRLVGSAVLRCRPSALRPPRGQARLRRVTEPLEERDLGAAPHDRNERTSGRCDLLRRTIRRRPVSPSISP